MFRLPSPHLILLGTTLAVLAACSGDGQGTLTAPSTPNQDPPAFTLRFSTESLDSEAGVSLPPVTVTVLDEAGQTATAATGPIVLALNGATGVTLEGTTTAALSAGVATFDDLTITTAGSAYRLAASGAGAPVTLSAPFEIRAGAPAELAWTDVPEDFALGGTFAIGVEARDTYGNVITDSALEVTAELVHPRFSPVQLGSVALGAGEARFSDVSVRSRDRGYAVRATLGAIESTSPVFDVYLPVLDFDVASTHSCVVADEHTHLGATVPAGHVYCWGTNSYGGIRTRLLAPKNFYYRPISSALDVRFSTLLATQVSLVSNSTCMISVEELVWCWGNNRSGQLGQDDVKGYTRAVEVPVGGPWEALDGGERHVCGMWTGQVVCWGANDAGQILLGNPSSDVMGPTLLNLGPGSSQVVSGGTHTCVRSSGRIRCWGETEFGRLGGGATAKAHDDQVVTGAIDFASVSAGGFHTCGLDDAGHAYCWGYNVDGQLGDGSNFDSPSPSRVTLPAGVRLTSISAGGRSTCGIDAEGNAYCWGTNLFGQAGATPSLQQRTPSLVPGGHRFIKIAASGTHTCGLSLERRIYCWGLGGSLGDEGIADSHTPRPIN